MALISPKNFMKPFTNKVHLATIAFIVILFAAFRAMGGAFSVQSSNGTSRGIRSSAPLGGDSTGRGSLSSLGLSDEEDANVASTNSEYDEVDSAVRSGPDRISGDGVSEDQASGDRAEGNRSGADTKPSKNDLEEIIRKLNSR